MKIKEILGTISHRPYPLPSGRWQYYQEWNKAVFLHWKVDINELKKYIPKQLEIDLFEGHPWVSVVAFTMEHVRPRTLPALSPISDFHETNIRTYVRHKGKAGVYFLSIEASKLISCHLAKQLSSLPYRFSKIKRSANRYMSSNATLKDKLAISFNIGDELHVKSEQDVWLTERYALFQDTATHLNQFDIHHIEWPIRAVQIEDITINYPRFDTILNYAPDACHYSDGVQVLAWGKQQSPL